MKSVLVACCLELGCNWSFCDFSITDEKIVCNAGEKHHNDTGHTVSVDRKADDEIFENIITFERKGA
jgi:hypothetical protein